MRRLSPSHAAALAWSAITAACFFAVALLYVNFLFRGEHLHARYLYPPPWLAWRLSGRAGTSAAFTRANTALESIKL